MAPKKAAAPVKSAPSSPGTALAKWDEILAQQAEIAAAVTGGSGGSFISFKAGQIAVDSNPVPGNKLTCIVTDHVFENALYEGKYDPENPQPPVCFAFGRDLQTMAPHKDSLEPQGGPTGKCHDCPMNVFGTGENGSGKACKNLRRLGLIAGDEESLTAEDIEAAEIKYAKTTVTSSKNWDGYVRQMAQNIKRPPFTLVTEISTAPDTKTQFKINFNLIEKIDNPELFDALMKKHEATTKAIEFPYQPPSPQAEKPKAQPKAAQKFANKRPQIQKRGR